MIFRSLLIMLLSFPVTLSLAQNTWEAWDEDVLRELNTGRGVNYLSDEEKKLILFMNMARHDGPLFVQTILDPYVKEKQVENNSYLRSLRKDLNKVEGWVLLFPEKDLTAAALGHAITSGKSGRVGHQGFDKRFDPLIGNPYTHVGENCSYGYETALDIVISLLIDDGIKDHGHRKNILAVDFNSVGVAIRPHKTYRINCVMDFGTRQRSE